MRDFQYHVPASLSEALLLLDQYREDARILSGGSALVNFMKQGLVSAEHIISLQRVTDSIRDITWEPDGLHLGARATHREVETSTLVKQRAPLISSVYSQVSTVRIRNVATVGGGLAHADPAQDPAPGLIASDATVHLASSHSDRFVPVAELFKDYFETILRPDEIIAEVIVPPAKPATSTVYFTFLPRTADDYATLSVAISLRGSLGTPITDVRVGLGGLGATPLPATAVEQALEGQEPTADVIQRAAEAVLTDISPLDDFRGSADYKREMAVVFVRRALQRALSQA